MNAIFGADVDSGIVCPVASLLDSGDSISWGDIVCGVDNTPGVGEEPGDVAKLSLGLGMTLEGIPVSTTFGSATNPGDDATWLGSTMSSLGVDRPGMVGEEVFCIAGNPVATLVGSPAVDAGELSVSEGFLSGEGVSS